ncbi:MAG: hypothetical protein ACI4WX_02985 [Aristaeellaceae bacterium]
MIEQIVAFLSTGYGMIATLCTALGVIWGGAKVWGEFMSLLSKHIEKSKERREIPQKTLDTLKEIREDMEGLKEQADKTEKAVSTLQNKELMFAYDYYGIRHHELPFYQKNTLERMHEQYGQNGHNHIPEDWQERIDSAPMPGEDHES